MGSNNEYEHQTTNKMNKKKVKEVEEIKAVTKEEVAIKKTTTSWNFTVDDNSITVTFPNAGIYTLGEYLYGVLKVSGIDVKISDNFSYKTQEEYDRPYNK